MTHFHGDTRAPRLWRRTAMAGVLLAGTALGGFAVGHAGFAARGHTRARRSIRQAAA